MSRSIDGVVGAMGPVRAVSRGRPFTRRGPTFEPRLSDRVSKDRPAGSTSGRVSLPRGTARTGRTRTSLKERLQLPLIIIGGMLAGFSIQSAILGQALIVAFGIACLIYRIPSRISFGLALAALSATTGLLVFVGNVILSQTFATYTFLLLVVGVISLNRELKREGGRVYSRRPRT